MIVNGWSLYLYPLFDWQLRQLEERVASLAASDPSGYREHPATKLLATIRRTILEIVPRNPAAAEFRQGNTLGAGNRFWFRVKFHRRYRLFFRFSTREKVIVYAWVNDERTLRKSGSKTDPYRVFRSMLEAGDPPATLEDILRKASEIGGQ
jgi:toxin YhaV